MGRIPLGLTRETQLAVIQLAAEMKISELYAVEYALNLGLYQLKKLDAEVYERHKRKWSETLVKPVDPAPLTRDELEVQQKIEEEKRYWAGILTQWDLHKDSLAWLERTRNYALKFPQIADAVRVVGMCERILANRVLVTQK